MSQTERKVIIIPSKPEAAQRQTAVKRQLRVAAYYRVSTEEEEQQSSYEAQCHYYTDKIMTNPDWTMAGIFADEGITGTSARKRPEFLRMIRLCRQKKIDLVLTKSISRFARNTVDCLDYVRALRTLGIAVIFEKENINTLESDSEMLITLLGAFAQAESESISANVRWGKRQAMREGKVSIQYKKLYALRRGENGEPEVIPEQAKVVRQIFHQYLSGASLRMIKDSLESNHIPIVSVEPVWSITAIRSILTNEKYCGDVLLQKTYVRDCISKQVVRNTGQLPMYLVQNNHEGIVDRKTFDAVQTEMARRNAGKSPSKKNASTGMSGQITNARVLESSPIPRVTMSLADIDLRLAELESQFQNLLAEAAEGSYQDYTAQFKSIADEMASLKEKRTDLETQRRDCGQIIQCVQEATEAMKNASSELTQWDESIIRQLVDTVKVLSEDRIMVYLRGGLEVEQEIRTSSV